MKQTDENTAVPHVSIIVPNYNHERFLEERLNSIFNQSFQNFEVILLDDCSQDASKDILSKYLHHPKVSHVIISESNSGSPFLQWKKGLLLAKGNWIWIAESDDSANNTFLEELMAMASQRPDMSLCFARSILINEEGIERGIYRWAEAIEPKRWSDDFINLGVDECAKFLVHRNTIPNASAVIFKRETGLKHIDHILNYKYCGDWLFWARITSDGFVGYSSKLLNKFRRYASATSLLKTEQRVVARVKEYMQLKQEITGLCERTKGTTLQHGWIIDEWIANKSNLRMAVYLFPPFYSQLKFRFYKSLFKRSVCYSMVSKFWQKFKSLFS